MAGYIWIAGDTPGYLNWNRDPTKNALVIYFLPMICSTDPSVWLPTPTLIELGHGMYTPARQEMGDDIIHMGRLRSRAHSTQPEPIQIHQVIDMEGTGAPISARSGGGSLRGSASGSGGNREAAGTSAFSGQDSGFPAANLSFSTPTGPVQRQSQQHSSSSGQGGSLG